MRIAVPRETAEGERRVALSPEHVARLTKQGHAIQVEHGAGAAAYLPDEAYAAAGATLAGGHASATAGAELVARVRAPTVREVDELPPGAVVVGLLAPDRNAEVLARLAARGLSALAMERVPRITRAQGMDALSSQANLAGYVAVLLGAEALPRILPMMTTAAGTLAPAKAFVVGAGVAGLQAIATARRLGAVVSAFDVRPAVKEQVRSLGATFLDVAEVAAEGHGGYAKELGAAEQERVLAAIAAHLREVDLVVTTAQVPGRPAPRLVTAAMVRAMRPGSVIVDLAAETGGNCELTRAGEIVAVGGVTVLGPRDLPSRVPLHASQTYGRNVSALAVHLAPKGALVLDPADEIAGPMLVVHAGKVREPRSP
jgi:NAD(P) transhydrogenase subunit alpha